MLKVLVDANVLFSKTLMDRSFFLRQANPESLRLCATEDILAEVVATMRRMWPEAPGHWTARRAELMRVVMDEVLTDFPSDVPFSGRDPHDYHVHAAAVAAKVDAVLTSNRSRDSPRPRAVNLTK